MVTPGRGPGRIPISDVLEPPQSHEARTHGKSQAQFHSFADAMPNGMAYQVHVSADRQTRKFLFVADNCPRLNGGVTVEQALANSEALYGLIVPEHRRRLHEAETRALETLQPFDVEAQFMLPTGERRWFRLTSSPRKLADGSTVWEGFQIDINARLSAQAALLASEERLALALDATALGLWEFNIVSGVLDWNPRIREMYGVGPADEVSFDTFVAAVHPDDRERVLTEYGKAAEAGGDFSFEHRVMRADDSVRWLLAHGRMLCDAAGAPARALGTAMDITARKQAEADNRLLLDELNHRVKNSFATVTALLQLRAKKAKAEEAREQLTAAVNQVMSIAQAYAHLYAGGQPRSLDFADYLHALCNGLATGMTDGERVRLTCSADSATMNTDLALPLGMAINELVTNAIKYAFPDGREGLIEVKFEVLERGWRLTISDNGVGLPADFDRQAGMGSGMIKAFARQAGGRLTVLDGPGARFEITSGAA